MSDDVFDYMWSICFMTTRSTSIAQIYLDFLYKSSILKYHFQYISEKYIKPISEKYIKSRLKVYFPILV